MLFKSSSSTKLTLRLLLLALILLIVFMFNPFKKSAKYEIVETRDFACPGITGFTFKYPVFKGLEIKKIERTDEVTCSVFLNEPIINANQENGSQANSPRFSINPTPAPFIQIIKKYIDGLPSATMKNKNGIFYEFIEGSPVHEYAFFVGEDFVINIDLFGISHKFPFSRKIFWQTVIESFKFIEAQSFKVQTFEGVLEERHVYAATWPIEADLTPKHAFNIEWKNLGDFPEIKKGSIIHFKVVSKKTYKVPNENRWNNEYVLEVLSLK